MTFYTERHCRRVVARRAVDIALVYALRIAVRDTY